MTGQLLRWRNWEGQGLQHVSVTRNDNGLVAEGVAIGDDPHPFAATFRIVADRDWLTRRVEVALVGGASLLLEGDGDGHWTLDGLPMAALDGTLEPDISITPLTNAFPVKRLRLAKGQSAEIRTAYVDVANMAVFADPQRYTCLEEGRLYLYESLDSDFRREVAFDGEGFVTDYPGLFRRLG